MREHKTVNQYVTLEFKNYILEKLENIRGIDNTDKELQQKLLYMAYLDGLAGARYNNYGNKKAFLSLIKNYSSWEYSDKICPLALMRLSDNHPELQSFALNSYNKMIDLGGAFGAAQVPLDVVPSKEELQSVWPEAWNEDNNSPKLAIVANVFGVNSCNKLQPSNKVSK